MLLLCLGAQRRNAVALVPTAETEGSESGPGPPLKQYVILPSKEWWARVRPDQYRRARRERCGCSVAKFARCVTGRSALKALGVELLGPFHVVGRHKAGRLPAQLTIVPTY